MLLSAIAHHADPAGVFLSLAARNALASSSSARQNQLMEAVGALSATSGVA